MEYEYEPELESRYRQALVKSFKKQVDEGFFPFIIIDCVNTFTSDYLEICNYARKNDFEVNKDRSLLRIRIEFVSHYDPCGRYIVIFD